ncbi:MULTISPECIES: amino acid ABC transporter permease [Arthrobacter]|uniref:Amino acid ABC transporter permease n=1 Tax=Arthrobacter terricola TaxID=2547396 RepID=A0A4R5KZH9_9MICC|nr:MULTISPECIES: amino acid ABC transporter permease [Arthrobacter]MBT8158852.1 amino acid ABC transporter permease [Arthrobacter sp. GN70]TDG01538.1 amino acid ABC transporter permease [Arthrobacter terricola]
MTSVLFDSPGPKARTRYRILGVVTALVIIAIVGFIVLRFAESGQFDAKKWRLFTFPLVQQTIVQSVGATLSAFATAAILSLALGILLAFGRLSDRRWISLPCYGFTEFFRAIPLLILMMIFYYGLPPLGVQGITPFTAVVAGLVLYNGSVLAEVFRAGIESLPRGQSEAGYAIGLRKSAVMTNILLPQAIRSMLPVIISQLVVILKDTALGFIVTYNEILFQAKYFGSQAQYGSPIIPSAIIAGVLYVGMCLILAGIAKWLESRMRRSPKVAKVAKSDIVAVEG